jgi:hypothetical protein
MGESFGDIVKVLFKNFFGRPQNSSFDMPIAPAKI